MVRILIGLVINAIALWVAAFVVPDIGLAGNLGTLAVVSIVFAVVNTFIKPIVKLLTCPLNILTLGLFTLVINALMLMLTSYFVGAERLDVGGFIPALLGGIVISIVSVVLSMFLIDDNS